MDILFYFILSDQRADSLLRMIRVRIIVIFGSKYRILSNLSRNFLPIFQKWDAA